MVEELIPIALFTAIALIFFIVMYFRHRGRADMQQTIRLALERGTELTPEIINRLGAPAEPSKNRDLRLGLIWLALAVGTALFGLAVPDPSDHAKMALLGISGFPFAIGLAYMIMWRYGTRSDSA